MTLKEFVIANVNPDKYYEDRFPGWDARVRTAVKCPFHDDGARPNFAISLRNGGAKCHSSTCGKAIGNIIHFESQRYATTESLAARRIYRQFIRPVVRTKELAQLRLQLAENTDYILRIKKEMGLGLASVKRFQLGFDLDSRRITIPVYDQFGLCVNVRYYRLPSERASKTEEKIYNKKGYGTNDLFPWTDALKFPTTTPIFFMASEKEAMLAIQDGLCAVSTTAGEGQWNTEWSFLFKDRDVFLVFDNDKGGRMGAERITPHLATIAKSVTNIELPFKSKRKDWKDYADWRLREKHQGAELIHISRKLLRNSPSAHALESKRVQACPEGKEYPEVPDLVEGEYDISSISSRSDLLNKLIQTKGIVAAKSPNTYSIPWKFKLKMRGRAPIIFKMEMSRELLRFVRASDTAILQLVQKLSGAINVEISPIAYLTVTEVEVIPTAAIEADVPYVVQRCYYFGERIEANIPYLLEIIPTSEIRSQETVGIITSIKALSKSVDRFDFAPENLADLSFFNPTDGESVWDKLSSLADEVARNYTRVYNRLDWTLAALLTWTSPIGWRFPSEPELQRGWLNTLALGDTETGKSKVSLALKALFGCGAFVSGENCTFVGLVGGAIKMGSGQLMLRWGRIPLSDKQLVVLEEMSGLSVEEISAMSDVRSSGIARLDKGGINSETNSRTRLLCLSNARSTKRSLSQYLFGIHAVQELIGHGEDIARFDLITTLTDKEVSIDLINSKFATVAKDEEYIAPDQYKKLIHFIWALTPDQIRFTNEAYEECLAQTKMLASKYHSSIPVFKGGSGRYKLGRIAASIACLQFAWDGEQVIVGEDHVRAAATLLQTIYRKPSFGYEQYSLQMFDRENIKDELLVRKTFKKEVATEALAKVLDTLIHSTRFTRDELTAVTSTTGMQADRLIGVMYRERVIRKGDANIWEITPAGKTFLEKFLQRLQNRK